MLNKADLTSYVGSLSPSKLSELDRALKMALDSPLAVLRLASVLHNLRKRRRIQAGAADQRAVDFLLPHQRRRIFRFHTAAVQNAQILRELVAKALLRLVPNDRMRVNRHLRSRGLAGADGPYRLIGNRKLGCFAAPRCR